MVKKPPKNNFAFIDIQNITLGMGELGWRLDWRKFSICLKEKYKVPKAFVFIGYISQNRYFYDFLRSCGYILIFKPVIVSENKIKANCDGDMIMFSVSKCHNFNKAVIANSDGDFYSTVKLLYRRNKLAVVLSPNSYKCSKLLKKEARERIVYLTELKKLLEHPK